MTRPYSGLSIALHWLMLVLLAAVYACIELREFYPRGSDIREGLKAWHFMLGLAAFGLVWVRLALRMPGQGQAHGRAHRRTAAHWAAAIMHLLLYAFMIVMPVLGWLILSAEGKPIPFFGLDLPPLTGPNAALGESLDELHETIGVIGYWLIGLHAAAALFHHYVLHDETMRIMLPRRRT